MRVLAIGSGARGFRSNGKFLAGREGFEEKEEAIQVVNDALRYISTRSLPSCCLLLGFGRGCWWGGERFRARKLRLEDGGGRRDWCGVRGGRSCGGALGIMV